MIFSVTSENHANIIEYGGERQGICWNELVFADLCAYFALSAVKPQQNRKDRKVGAKIRKGIEVQTSNPDQSVLLKDPSEFFEVIDETTMFEASGFIVRSAQN